MFQLSGFYCSLLREVRGLTSGRHLAVKVTELDKMRLQASAWGLRGLGFRV